MQSPGDEIGKIREMLSQCIDILSESVLQAVKDGEIALVIEDYVKKNHYSVIPKSVPSQLQLYSFVESLMNNQSVFRDTIANLAKGSSNGMGEKQIKYRFRSLMMEIASRIVSENGSIIGSFKKDEVLSSIMLELQKETCRWRLTSVIEGIDFSHEVRVNGLFTLKKASSDQISWELPLAQLIAFFDSGRGVIMQEGDSLLEIQGESKDSSEQQKTIPRILQMLRLFRVGSVRLSVRTGSTIVEPISFLRPSYDYSSKEYPIPYSYSFSPPDIELFNRFEKEYGTSIDYILTAEEFGDVSTAVERYNSALLYSESVQSRIVNLISAMESLLLSEDERNLGEILSMRASSLLSVFGENKVVLRELVKTSYEIRSVVVHGERFTEEKDNQDAREKSSRELPEIVRKIILISIQIRHRNGISHKEFIANVDAIGEGTAKSKKFEGILSDLFVP